MDDARSFYAGFTRLKLLPDWEEYELGEGLCLRPTFIHLAESFKATFNPPAQPGKLYPDPWEVTEEFQSFDIHTELRIPTSYKPPKGVSKREIARIITVMMRLVCDPKIRFVVMSEHPLAASESNAHLEIFLIEAFRQYIGLALPDEDPTSVAGRLKWVRDKWRNAVYLYASVGSFRLAMEAFEMSTFIPHDALTLVSLWGALEALFSPEPFELKFRVSVLIASYLHPPGPERLAMQQSVSKLYDKRSAAAHGRASKHSKEDLAQTYSIMRRALVRMIDAKEVPSRNALNNMLLGVVGEQGSSLSDTAASEKARS